MLLDRLDEADEQTETARQHASADDINAQLMWRPVPATILARRGDFVRGEALAREGVEIADRTDDLNRRAKAHRALGDTLRRAARPAKPPQRSPAPWSSSS